MGPASSAEPITGGCFCGHVRYEIHGTPAYETSCHCSDCRRVSGAPYVAWFTVPAAGLRFCAGEPARFDSSAHGRRSFCPHCGTPLTFSRRDLPDEIDVTTCSLDEPERVPPRDHTRVASKLSWVEPGDDLPRFSGPRP